MTTPAVRDVLQSYEDELVPLTWDSSLGETVSWCIKNGLLERDPVERRSIGGQVLACEFRITELGRYLLTALCGKEQP